MRTVQVPPSGLVHFFCTSVNLLHFSLVVFLCLQPSGHHTFDFNKASQNITFLKKKTHTCETQKHVHIENASKDPIRINN